MSSGKIDKDNSVITNAAMRAGGELSLIDLACILVKWRKLVFFVFLVFVALGVALALALPRLFVYTSVYQLAQYDQGATLQSASSVLVSIKSVYLPEERGQLDSGSNGKLAHINVEASSPAGTSLILLTSKGKQAQASDIKKIQSGVLLRVQEEENDLMSKRKKTLQLRLDSLNKRLESLRGGVGVDAEVASVLATKEKIEDQLESLSAGVVMASARQSLRPSGVSHLLVVVVALLIGAIFSILSGFFAEFAHQVKVRTSNPVD